MGQSGSGKTTLLNVISTIDKVTSGHIYVDGKDITKLKGNRLNQLRREELGFIFQDFNLLDTMTAFENIALALTIAGKKGKEVENLVKKAAQNLVSGKYEGQRVILVVRRPADVLRMMDRGVTITQVNIGNLPAREGTRNIKKSINMTIQEMEECRELNMSKNQRE